MLGVKTGYWTWGTLWIPLSTSVWSAIYVKGMINDVLKKKKLYLILHKKTAKITNPITFPGTNSWTCRCFFSVPSIVRKHWYNLWQSMKWWLINKIVLKKKRSKAMPEAQIFLCAFAPLSGSLMNHSALSVLHKEELLPVVPILRRQSWWPRSQAGRLLKACLSAGFSPLSEQFPGKQWNWNSSLWTWRSSSCWYL